MQPPNQFEEIAKTLQKLALKHASIQAGILAAVCFVSELLAAGPHRTGIWAVVAAAVGAARIVLVKLHPAKVPFVGIPTRCPVHCPTGDQPSSAKAPGGYL